MRLFLCKTSNLMQLHNKTARWFEAISFDYPPPSFYSFLPDKHPSLIRPKLFCGNYSDYPRRQRVSFYLRWKIRCETLKLLRNKKSRSEKLLGITGTKGMSHFWFPFRPWTLLSVWETLLRCFWCLKNPPALIQVFIGLSQSGSCPRPAWPLQNKKQIDSFFYLSEAEASSRSVHSLCCIQRRLSSVRSVCSSSVWGFSPDVSSSSLTQLMEQRQQPFITAGASLVP